MNEIDGLGSFYLGKPYDVEAKKLGDGYVLYDSKHLTTHAVCVGMTGSGKTGLCVGVIESTRSPRSTRRSSSGRRRPTST